MHCKLQTEFFPSSLWPYNGVHGSWTKGRKNWGSLNYVQYGQGDEESKTFYCTVSLLYKSCKCLTGSGNNFIPADRLLMSYAHEKQNKSILNCCNLSTCFNFTELNESFKFYLPWKLIWTLGDKSWKVWAHKKNSFKC